MFERKSTTFQISLSSIPTTDTVFTFKTNLLAPHYKLITIDMADPNYEKKDLVAESRTDVLNWALCVAKDKLVLNYLQDVRAALFLHDLKTGFVKLSGYDSKIDG